MISATIDPQGLATSYGFEIATSTNYGAPTGLGAIGVGASEVPVTLTLTSLQPGTTYHYRIEASNVYGTDTAPTRHSQPQYSQSHSPHPRRRCRS